MTEPKIKIKVHLSEWRTLEFMIAYLLIQYEGNQTQMVLRSMQKKISSKIYTYHKKLEEREVSGKIPKKDKMQVSFSHYEVRYFYEKVLPILENKEIVSFWFQMHQQGLELTGKECMSEYEQRKYEYDTLIAENPLLKRQVSMYLI